MQMGDTSACTRLRDAALEALDISVVLRASRQVLFVLVQKSAGTFCTSAARTVVLDISVVLRACCQVFIIVVARYFLY
jgi:hypothetical protein